MTIVSLLDRATSTWSSVAVLVTITCVFTFLVAPRLQLSLNEEEAGSPPDLRFGYTASELNSWYDAIGEEGCQAYKKLAILDLICYMPSYTLLFGGLLVKAARGASVDTEIALLMPIVMLCDVVETSIPLYGCFISPERLPLPLISLSAACNKLKWTLFMVCNVVLCFLFFASVLKAAVKKKEKMFDKKDTTKTKKKTAKKKD